MTEPAPQFKRMLLGLPHSAKDFASVAFTAELADLLGLDLIGIFAEDEKLIDLAMIPCVREFRLTGDGWHRLDATQLQQSSDQAAANAQRLFADAAKTLRGSARLDFIKGQIGDVIRLQSLPNDIIVVIEPRNPAERVTHQFRQFMEMTLRAPTATLHVPSRIFRRKGPIVAIAENEGAASIQVGLRIAEAAGERLLVLTPDRDNEALSARLSPKAAVHFERRLLPTTGIGLPELSSVLAMAGERLLVICPDSKNLIPSQLASERGVPVLTTARREPSS